MVTWRQVSAACVLLLGLAPGAFAQASASIAGTVRDSSGAVLPGVTVEASSPVLIEKIRTGGDRQRGPVPDRATARRRLHRHVLAVGLSNAQARRRRAERVVCGDRERRPESRRARRDHHRHGRNARRGRPERDQAARRGSGTARGDSDRPHAAGRGVSDSRRQPEQRGCRRHEHHQHHRRVVVRARRQSRRHTSAD